jgi:hypothetical protein
MSSKIVTLPLEQDINNTLVLHMFASGADTTYVSATGLGKQTRHVRNLAFQAKTSVEVSFTLCPTTEAMDPDPAIQAGILWDVVTVPANTITMFNKTFTAMRIKFLGAGELHIGLE